MTIGFSEKSKSWTSNYSYRPMHISANSEHMVTFSKNLSSTNVSENQSLCWSHKGNSQFKNTFYRKFSPSVFSVVFNQNQSMEKVFNALSIESNQNQFFASLSTNIDQPFPDLNSTKPQVSYIPKFHDREETLYAECSKSSINSKQNVSLFGANPQVASISLVDNQPGSSELRIKFDQITSHIPSGGKLFLFSNADNAPSYYSFVNGNGIVSNGSLDYSNEHKGFTFVSNNNEVRVLFESLPPAALFGNLLQNIFNQSTFIGCINDPSIYGDDMRGKYMVATFSSNETKPFEVSGLNCEFSHSKLDSL